MEKVIIQTERLILEEIGWEDLEIVNFIHSSPEVEKFNTLGIPKNIETTRSVIQPDIEDQDKSLRSRYCWKILLRENNKIIGLSGMFLSNDRFKTAEFYYSFLPEYWRNGFATETAKRIIEFGFVNHKLHRIEAGVATENLASVKVLEKAGMTCEGIRRKILPIRGEWKDNFHFAILEDEFYGK